MTRLAGLLTVYDENCEWRPRLCTLKSKVLTIFKNCEGNETEKQIELEPGTEIKIAESMEDGKSDYEIQIKGKELIRIKTDNKVTFNTWYSVLTGASVCPSSITIDDFNIVGEIGNGSYGKVKLAVKKDTGDVFAIKIIEKEKIAEYNIVERVLMERNALMTVSCPFIVQMYYAFQNESNCYICLEYVSGGDLFNHMKLSGTIPINELRLYVAEISIALHYLHQNNIVYRDLKPENVLLNDDGHIKLTDFGLSKVLSDGGETGSFCGTAEYLAPEVVLQKPYGPEVDWWSLGVLIYEMVFKTSPFYSVNENRIYDKIKKMRVIFPGVVDANLVSLIKGLLQKDPKKRFGFNEVMNHPLLRSLDIEKINKKEYTPSFLPFSASSSIDNLAKCSEENDGLLENVVNDIPTAYRKIPGFSFSTDDVVVDTQPICDIQSTNRSDEIPIDIENTY